MIADSAVGHSTITVAPASSSMLTANYKINMLVPADGEKLIARGAIICLGKTLIVTKAEVFACKDDQEALWAIMQQTIMVDAQQNRKITR